MHVHLPKPMHGWRAFAGEVGIIVVGVLIALGAEQVVETLHWRSEVATERASLLQEARDSMEIIAARAKQQGCVDRRLAEIHRLLEQHHRGSTMRAIALVGEPAHYYATRGTWQIALAGEALGHMPHAEKLKFSDAFGWFDVWDRYIQDETAIWKRLAPLNTPDLLSDEDWSKLTSAFAEADVTNESIRGLAPQILAKDLPDVWQYRAQANFSRNQAMTRPICKPIIAANLPSSSAPAPVQRK